MRLLGLHGLFLWLTLLLTGAAITWLFLRRRPAQRVLVASLSLWQALSSEADPVAARARRVRPLAALLLALATALALVLALSDPLREATTPPRSVVLAIDRSASMAATDVAGSRLAQAKLAAKAYVDALPESAYAMVLAVDRSATPLTSFTRDRAVLRRAIEGLEVRDETGDLLPTARLAVELLRRRSVPELLLFSDGNLANVSESLQRLARAPKLRSAQHAVGRGSRNIAITGFSLRRYPLDKTHQESLLALENFGDQREPLTLRIHAAAGLLHEENLTLEPRQRVTRTLSDLPSSGATLEAALTLAQGPDALALDDRARATLPARPRTRVLAVSRDDRYLEAALLLDDSLDVDEVAPEEYRSSDGYDVVIFDGTLPAKAPTIPALYLGPGSAPGALPLARAQLVERPFFDRVDTTHPLTRALSWSDVNVARAVQLTLGEGDHAVAESRDARDLRTPLLVAGARNATPFVVLAFDPRESDLPLRAAFPLFLPRAIDFLAGHGEADDVSAPSGARTKDESAIAPRHDLLGPARSRDSEKPASSVVPARMWPALALLALVMLALSWLTPTARRELAALPSRRRAAAWLVRALAVLGAVLALAQPTRMVTSERSSTVFVVDVSDSMDDDALADARHYITRASAARSAEHQLALVTFAGDATVQPLPSAGHAADWTLARHGSGRASDIEHALSLALGQLAPDAVAQVVLFSDGRETRGELARAARALAQQRVSLWVQPPRTQRPEVSVLELRAPADLRAGTPFVLSARLAASTAEQVRVQLFRDGRDDGPEATRTVQLDPGETTLSFRSLVPRAGRVSYTLALTPLGSDQIADNNRARHDVEVRGAPRVLYVEREPEQAYALLDLLRGARFEVELRTPERAPRSAAELSAFDFYILSDVPAVDLSGASLEAIATFVQSGGGFMMAGGERSLGLGGFRGTPLEPLLPVLLEGSAQRDEPSLALMLAIDKSGSMVGDKLERAKLAAIATAELLPAGSYLGVIGFDAQPLRVAPLARVRPMGQLARDVGTLAAGGGTALFPTLDAAYADLAGIRARIKHVVVLTDGQTQEESLDVIAQSMHADGITISTIGLGEDVNRGLLEQLAARAGGRSYFTRDPTRVPRLFAQEAQLLSRSSAVELSVRVQVASHADFLAGIALDRAPALRGYVATRARPAPAQQVLVSDRGDPILARMRVGLGWSLALTTDLKPRWSVDWFRWRQHGALLAQLVREHMRQDERTTLPIATRPEGDGVVAAIDVLDERGRFVNDLSGTLHVQGDHGVGSERALVAVAPGRYEAPVPLERLGSYALSAALTPASSQTSPPQASGGAAAPTPASAIARGTTNLSFPAEYRPPFSPDLERFTAAARRTGSAALPFAERLHTASGRVVKQARTLWQPLLWGVLGLFLSELALRRGGPLKRGRRHGA